MNRFFKLYKFLFEDDKYKSIGLNSKVAYCVYRDLIQQNKNIKKDKEGKVYRKPKKIFNEYSKCIYKYSY